MKMRVEGLHYLIFAEGKWKKLKSENVYATIDHDRFCLVFYFYCDFPVTAFRHPVSQFLTTAMDVILGEGWFDISIINLLIIEVTLTHFKS
jgi:hypothetical protein